MGEPSFQDIGNAYAQYATDMYAWAQENGFVIPTPNQIQPNASVAGYESDYYNWASQYTTSPTPGIAPSYSRVPQPVLATLVSDAFETSYNANNTWIQKLNPSTGTTYINNILRDNQIKVPEPDQFTFLGFTGIMAIFVMMILIQSMNRR